MNSISKKYFIIYFEVSSSASKTVQMSLGADADWKKNKKFQWLLLSYENILDHKFLIFLVG